MKVVAVGAVRNEADILRINVQHHLALGIDEFLFVDNGSTDGTPDVLSDLVAAGLPVRWRREEGAFVQTEVLTRLAREAGQDADWVLPIDADEFWCSVERPLKSVLRAASWGSVAVPVVNFVQRREQLEVTPDCLLTMTMRVAEPRGPHERIVELVETEQVGFVEAVYYPKVISRFGPALEIGPGNHYVRNAPGPQGEAPGVVCLHAPLRARSVLYAKTDIDRDPREIREYLDLSWHITRWRRLASLGFLDREWAANSYDAAGSLDVFGTAHPLVADHTLRDLVAPWIEPEAAAPARPAPIEIRTGSAARPRSTRVTGVMIVRNEADIIAANLFHHHAAGVDDFLVLDNGSRDGTDRILERLARELPLRWTRDDGPFRQAEMTTGLAREAFRGGATWILPIDADEFWTAEYGTIHAALERTRAAALQCAVINFVQRREQLTVTPTCLPTMTMTPDPPVTPVEITRDLVEAGRIGYIEAAYPPKWISRASENSAIAQGNHFIAGIEGELAATDRIICMHAALRARSVLEHQVEYGRRLNEMGPGEDAWHVRRWAALAEQGGLDLEWDANSYAAGAVDVYGERHALAVDDRLSRRTAAAVYRASAWLEQNDTSTVRTNRGRRAEPRAAMSAYRVTGRAGGEKSDERRPSRS